MIRGILLILAWLAAALGLWVLLVILEVYWKLYDWQPKLDARALGLGMGICLDVVGMLLLARATRRPAARAASLLISLALLALAVYVVPKEPLTSGMFAREQSSPSWYRVSGFFVLASPILFWASSFNWRNDRPSQPEGSAERRPGGPACKFASCDQAR